MKIIYPSILIFLFLGIGTIVNAQTTWYLKNTGAWNVASNWTQDPAAAITVPSGGGIPAINDNIVIPSGKTVTLAENVTTSLGTVSIYGDLDMATFTMNGISTLKGNGRLLMSGDNYPSIGDDSDFVTKGKGEGTVVFYGSSGITLSNGDADFYNVEVDLLDENSEVRIDRNLDINGSLYVKVGRFKIGQTSGIQRTVNVFGDINISSGARMTEGGTGNYHWLNVYGDFTNNGIVDFARQPQYTESTGGAVKLKFKGTTDNFMVINSRTDVYRLFIDKGTDKTYKLTVNAISDDLFNLYGPVSGNTTDSEDGSQGWQRLPIVIENGTLELGAGITIDRLGESIGGDAPNEFLVPSTGCLWINGANVNTASGAGGWRGLSLFGTLKVSSGSLTTPAGTGGIAFGTQSGLAPEINVEGGDLYLTQIRNYYTGSLFSYVQSGGEVHFFARPDNTALPTFYMEQSTFAFNMSGGQITFAAANNHWQGDFYIAVADENYSFTGGTVEVQTLSTGTFDIYSVQPLYNLNIVQGVGTDNVRIIDQYGDVGNPSYLKILNDLTVGSGATFDDSGYDVTVGGDFNIAGTYTQAGGLTFNGAQDGIIDNQTGGTLSFNSGLIINKDRHPSSGSYYKMSLSGNNIAVAGNIDIERGGLDVVDYWPTVTDSVKISDGDLSSTGIGGIEFIGSSPVLKGKYGREFNFGNIRLNNGNSGMSLATDVNVEDFEFVNGGSGKVNMGIYNFTATGTVSNADDDSYFYTAGNASDGGLTLGFSVPNSNSTLATYHVGTSTSDYSTLVVNSLAGQTGTPSGYFTVVPVHSYHPSTTTPSGVLNYYWKTKVSGFDLLTDNHVQLQFTSSEDLKNLKVAFLDGYDWTIGDTKYNNGDKTLFFDYTTGNAQYTTLINSDYTAGLDNGQGKIPIAGVKIYTSQGDYDWNSASCWLDQDLNSGTPTSSDVAKILPGHTVTISTTAVASQVQIDGTLSVIDGASGTIDIIKGGGTLIYEQNGSWLNSPDYEGLFVFLNGDHSEFCNNSTATIELTGACNPGYLPSNSQLPYYPNLKINTSGEIRCQQSEDVQINQNLIVESGTLNFLSYEGQTVTVEGDISIGAGNLAFYNTNNSNRYLQIGGDLIFTGTGSLTDNGGTGNDFYLFGDVNQNNGIIDLTYATIVFEGTESATYSNTGGSADFNRIEVNKPVGQSVTFNSDFDLNGSTSGTTKALELISGECHINHSDINIDLTTGGSNYDIPQGAKLYVTQGAVYASGDSDIKLEGSLIVNGGTANIDGTIAAGGSNGSSNIEYTASGQAYLEVSASGTLNVGGQICRSLANNEGIIQFVQNGGTLSVGTVNAPYSTRGMFEILGVGSSFSQAASDVVVINRSNGSTTVPTLYFDPETVVYGTGSGFTLDGSTVTDETFVVYSTQNLNDFTVTGGTNNVAVLKTISHTIDGDLTIGTGASFDANGLDLYVNGDYVNNGTYNASNNTLYFTGSSDQSITGSGANNFYNLVLNSGNTLSSSSDLNISNNLTISSGILNTGGNVVNVIGDVVNNGSTLSSSGNGIVLNSTVGSQSISGSGSYQNLTIDNSDGVVMPSQSSAITITGVLKLEDGIFDIGRNLMEMTNGAVFDYGTTYSDFTSNNMIQTNLSFTDAGINKTFNNTELGSFIYPVGSFGLYTPVTINVVANGNSTGSIRVKAANEPHVTISSENLGQVLQYNWTLDAEGISGFQGDIAMQANPSDEVGTISDYIGVRFELGGTEVNLYEEANSYDETNHLLNIDFNNPGVYLTDADIDGDYTAGESTVDYDVQAFISVANGNWTSGSTWDYYDPETGTTSENSEAIPNGAIVYIADGTTVTMNVDELVAYGTYIQGTGRLEVGTTQNHRLGTVSGTGTLSVGTGSLPAGVYTNFVSPLGGTLEYAGTYTGSILSETSKVNNLTFLGSGTRSLPNYESGGVTVYGTLTINGPTVQAYNGKVLELKGDVIFTSGSFDANYATVVINGSTLQDISGTTDFVSTDGGAFYNFIIANPSGVTISNDIEISNILTLDNGVIYTDAGGSLIVTNTLSAAVSGGGTSSYVQGPMKKRIPEGAGFTFPLGDQNRYLPLAVLTEGSGGSPEVWEAQYYSHNPNNDNLYVANLGTGVSYVSQGEYWRVMGPDTETAKITLNWDNLSGVNPDDEDFMVVEWVPSQWNNVGNLTIDPLSTSSSGNVQISTSQTFNNFSGLGNYYTFGSITIPAFTWTGNISTDWFTAGNWTGGIVPSASSQVTIAGTNPAIISGAASVNSLTVNAGSSLTLNPGSQFTLVGDLIINDDGDVNTEEFVVNNSIASPVSVILNGTESGSGKVTYKWTGFTTLNWWQISHPVKGADQSEYDASFGINRYAVNRYVGTGVTANGWERVVGFSNVYSDSYVLDDTGKELEGYSLYTANPGILSYSGTFKNDAAYSMSNPDARWYLVANPYPSYIDVEEAGFDIGNFLKTVYIRKGDDEVSTYNILTNVGLLGGSRYVAPGQSMWLRTYEVNDAISVSNTSRVHASGSLKSSVVENDNIFRFTLSGSNNTDESVILLSEEFGADFVSKFDSEKLMSGGNKVNIYSLKDSKDISINAFPELLNERVVPLGYTVSSEGMSDFTFRATNIGNFKPNVDVFLVDKGIADEIVTVNLRETPSYTFTPLANESNDRFELHFKPSVTTGIDDEFKSVFENNITIYAVKQDAIIKVSEQVLQEKNRSINIYNVSGQLIKQVELNNEETTVTLPQTNMVYIISVKAGGDTYHQKVVSQQ